MIKKILKHTKNKFLKIKLKGCFIDKAVRISDKKNFFPEEKTALYHGTYIQNTTGKFFIGNNSHLGAYCFVNVVRGNCKIGNHTSIGPGVKIIVYSNHFEKGKLNTEVRICKDVVIGNNVFIGANCTILPGVIIEDNVVVGAGAVVKGKLKKNGIYVGIPAKLIKSI